MDVDDAIRSRRSIRTFKNTPVPRETIEELVALGQWAPSNCNVQGWRFIVIDDVELKTRIVDRGGSPIIASAPVGIVVCYDRRSANDDYRDWLQSAAAASQNILLGAHARGLGCCWICRLPRPGDLRSLLNIAPAYAPVAYLAIGYPLERQETIERRRPCAEIYTYNRFPGSVDRGDGTLRLLVKRTARKCYYALPLFLKKKINPLIDRYCVKHYEN